MKNTIFLLLILVVLAACSTKLPSEYTEVDGNLDIYPDYREVFAPCNIAPLSFHIYNEAEDYVTSISKEGQELILGGRDVVPSVDAWRTLIQDGGEIKVTNYLKVDGKWQKRPDWHIHIVTDSIDNYLSYRLISPGYIIYNDLTINQRDLTSWEEKVIYDTRMASTAAKAQCINCHSFHNYDGGKMQFHARAAFGGTMIIEDGVVSKYNLKTDSTLSAGVYPAWHPSGKMIAYSVNNTGQSFHSRNANKVEVQDEESDMVLFDIANKTISPVSVGKDALECFPTWSPDGKWLYYSKAMFRSEGEEQQVWEELRQNYSQVKYNIVRRSFDIDTKTFGEEEMVLKADTMPSRYYPVVGLSATLPRFSPDGKYLAVSIGAYGVFHIWHKDADIYMLDTTTGEGRYMDGLNSEDVESYHSWSSNGRWMVVSTRREDGSYTRPYFSYIDASGNAHKPFVLPQQDPLSNKQLMRSYNIPEFTKTPVTVTPHEIFSRMKRDAEQVKFSR